MIKISKANSKLNIISKKIPSTLAVTVLVMVKTGSRNENSKNRGIAHFQEHMFFKGGDKYKTTKEVSQAIDSVGGTFNAYTSKEYVGYYVKVESSHIDLALDVLSDMLVNAKFEEQDIEKERGVILEEYAMYQDTPMYQVGWEFENLLYGDNPMGWDVIGTPETIKSMKREDFLNFKNTWYQPENIAICVTGSFDEESLKDRVDSYFKFESSKKVPETKLFKTPENPTRLYVTERKTEQTHIVLGTYGLGYKNKHTMASKLFSIAIGGNMSSRLFQRIREEKGYAYYIRSISDQFSDTGSFYTRSGVNNGKVEDAVKLIIEEYNQILKTGITDEEISHAKEYYKGHMTLDHEDSEHVANSIGRRFFFEDSLQEIEERKAEIDAVELEEVNEIAKQILSQKMFLSVIGPHDKNKFIPLIE